MAAPAAAPVEAGRMTLVEHLTELRRRIVTSVIAIAAGGVVCWIFYPDILDFLVRPYCESLPERARRASGALSGGSDDCALLQTEPLAGFSLRMTVAGYGGLVIAIPVVLWQVWRFITPGLYAHEKKWAIPFVLSGVALFTLGGGLAFWTLPKALEFLIDIGGPDLVTVFAPNAYLSFVIKMIVGFGLGFELPLILVFLQLIGVLSNGTLRRGRRYAMVGIVAVGAVLTPSGDPFTLMALSIPLYVLYEISILIGWWTRARGSRGAE